MIYDIAIIGAGPGGYVCALKAAQKGLKTALIEKGHVGGTCLNTGCIPTKSFAAIAEKVLLLQRLGVLGFKDVSYSMPEMLEVVARKDRIVEDLRKGILQLLKGRKVDLFNGTARFESNERLAVLGPDSREVQVSFKNAVIASGSSWRDLPSLSPDGKFILTSDDILNIKSIPKRLVIVGGGVIGCELASIMNALGSDVTIIEMLGQILPMESASVARFLAASFKKRGISIAVGKTVKLVGCSSVELSDGTVLPADMVLVSIGRKPYIEGLGVEKIGLFISRGFVEVDESMRTNISNIYAIGDLAIPKSGSIKPMLAHVASFEASVALNSITGSKTPRPLNYLAVPRPVFTFPEISCVGYTEEQLKSLGKDYSSGRYSYTGLSKAVCDSDTEGIMQIYADSHGIILGAWCIGNRATDIMAEVQLAIRNNLDIDRVLETIHAHPTYSEIVTEVLEDAKGTPLHKL